MTGAVFPRRFAALTAAAFGLWLAFGVILNPFFSDQYQVANALLAGEALLALGALSIALFRAWRLESARSASPLVGEALGVRGTPNEERETFGKQVHQAEPNHPISDSTPSPSAWFALLTIFLAALYLHRWEWAYPRFIDDDLINLRIAQSWQSTRDHLLTPFNEHLLIPTRLWAFAAVQLASPQALPYVLLTSIWVLFAAALVQLFLLARREFRSDAAALLAVAGFTLTYLHHECLWWFMAAQWLWTLILLLGVWLILDPSRPTAARANLAAVAAFIGPFCFSIGLVVGPCAGAWILCRWRSNRGLWWRPLAGMLSGLLTTAPLVAAGLRLQDPGAANVQLKWFELQLWQGLGCTARLVVDHLVFRNLGISPGAVASAVPESFTRLGFLPTFWPPFVAAVMFPFVAALPIAILHRCPSCWRLAPFLLLIVLNYGIVVPFRSWMDYPQMSNWTARYHLLPHLGLVLFLIGAWSENRSTARHSVAFALFAAALLFLFQESTHGRWQWPS